MNTKDEALALVNKVDQEQPAPPPECQTEAEKTAFAFGWWKALESVRQPSKPWVGLTLGEAVEIWTKTKQLDTVIKLVEAKLKEKNA